MWTKRGASVKRAGGLKTNEFLSTLHHFGVFSKNAVSWGRFSIRRLKQAHACPPHTAVPRKLCICKTAVSDWRAGTQVFTADPSWPISFDLRHVHVLHSVTSITPWWVQASYLYLYIYIYLGWRKFGGISVSM